MSCGKLTAAILAGGLGTRLRGVVADRPKPLAMVCGRPFLTFLLDQLAGTGVQQVVLCTGYRGEQIRSAFGARYRNLSLVYSPEPAPRGTGGALRQAMSMLNSQTILVMNGDSYCGLDFDTFLGHHEKAGARASIGLTHVSDMERYGRVVVDEACCVTRFEEKGAVTGAGWINAGLYLLDRDLIAAIEPNVAVSLEREVFPAQIGTGLWAWKIGGRFLDIGTPASYEQANEFFASGAVGGTTTP